MAVKRFLILLLVIFYIIAFTNIIKGEEFMNSNHPFVSIPRIKDPKIDGKIDNKEWSQGVGISNFLLIDGSKLAAEQTFCYMGCDKNNIYFALKMNEFALDPVSNQAHEFKAKLKGKQAKIWEDDSIEIRISHPMNPLKIYYLGVNANAATYYLTINYSQDGSLKNMKEWAPNIKVKTSINDGYWLAEVAIPFKDLGTYFKTDKLGRLQIIRFEKRLKETSSWSTLSGSLLEIKKYGYFGLSEDGPSIQFSGIPNMSSGDNNISLSVFSPKKLCGSIKTVVLSGNTSPAEYEKLFMVKANESKLVTANFGINMPSRDWVQIFVYEDSDKLLYRTKNICYSRDTIPTKFPDLILEGQIAGKRKISLYLNEKKIIMSNKMKESLQPGLNLLAIHIPSDSKISGDFKIDGQIISFDSTWKYAFNPEDGWEKTGYNDSKWKKFNPDLLKQSRDKNLYLRKIILISASHTFPKFRDNTIYLSVGGAYGFQIMQTGIPGWNLNRNVNNYKIYMDLPKGIELIGACSKVGRTYRVSPQYWKDKDIYSFHSLEEFKRGDEIYNRYVIMRSGTVRFSSKTTREEIYNSCHIVIKALEETKNWDANAEKQIYYRSEAENGYIQEIDNVLKVKVLPQLKGISPKNIYITLGGHIRFFDFMADENMLLNLADTLKSAGINEMQYWGHVDIPGKTGIKTFNFVIIGRGAVPVPAENGIDTTEVLDKFPERRHVNQSGRRNERGICWDFVLSNKEASNTLKKAVHAYCKRFPYQTTLFWDWEYPPFSKTRIQSVFSCFCDDCLEKFRKEKGIKEKVNVELIEKKYLEQWIDFQTSMLAKMMGLVSEAAHECGKQFTTYSTYHGQYAIEHYGFDYNKISPYVDRALAGYGRPVEAIAATKQALHGKPLIGGVLSISAIPNVSSTAELLRRIIDCGGGVLCWWEDLYDARKLSEVAQASQFVASYEDFFLKGKCANDIIMCPIEDIFEVRRYKNKYLAICLNENRQPLTVPFKFSKPVENVRDAKTLKSLKLIKPMKISISGGSFKAFIFECK